METMFITEILKSIGEGNPTKGIFMILVFVVVWLEVRALKKQFKTLNTTVSNSFAAGEKRFKTIETDVHQIRVDLDGLKTLFPGGIENGKTI